MTPKDILKSRGIYEAAIQAGWREGREYWEYDLYSPDGKIIGIRGKRYPNTQGAKYIWIPKKPDNLDSQWYAPKGTFEAIRQANGIAYLANGSPALLAYHAAGIYNVIATELSEVAFPKEGVKYLQENGINRLIYPVDKDLAGHKSAIVWKNELSGSGIDFEALELPSELPPKSDVNDLWIYWQFDKTKTLEALASCEALELPELKARPIKPIETPENTPQGLIDLIASHFGIIHWKADGFSRKNVLCPFHDDTEPSAGFNHLSGVLNCHVCGAHSPKEVAERIGINWKPFYPKREKKAKKSKEPSLKEIETVLSISLEEMIEHPAKPIFINTAWIQQPELPLAWIKAFLHLTHSKSITVLLAIELHRAIYKGLIDGQDFTMKDILKIFQHPRKSTTYSVEFLTSINFVSILHTNLLEESTLTESTQKDLSPKKQGRPETHYRLNTHTPSLAIALAERLEPVLFERLSSDLERAPRNHLLRDALDLDLADFKAWAERTNSPKTDTISAFISETICNVMENTSYIEFSEQDLEHPSKLRGKLLKLILEPYSESLITLADGSQVLRERKGLQLSRAKSSWELGCSPSALTKLYEENHIGTKEIYAWYEVVNPNGADIEKEIREAPYNINKEIGGVAYGGVLHYWDYGILKKTKLLPRQELIAEFEKRNHKIERLYLQVQQPSLLWNMTEAEIAEKRAKEAKLAEESLNSADSLEKRDLVHTEAEKQAPKKRSTVAGKDRLYTGLSSEFVRNEIEKEVRDFSQYTLKGMAILEESTGEIIQTVKSLKEVVLWLNEYTRKDKTVVITTPKPIIPPLPKLPELPKLPLKQEKGFTPIDWTLPENQALFDERMAALGTRIK